MKKLLSSFIFGILAMSTLSAHAAQARKPTSTEAWQRPYGMAGCGLGSVLIGKHSAQIFAATTNGTAWNQSFGITFNTSNCVDSPNNEVAQRLDTFIVANKVAVAGDMARGNGETLTNLSAMMGCESKVDQFGSTMQKNFREIFPNTEVQPNEVTDSIINVIMKDQDLSANCKNIS